MAVNGEAIAAWVFGGQGYVAGELLRLLAYHPRFRVSRVFSTSQEGERVAAAFPHLAETLGDLTFAAQESFSEALEPGLGAALFFATPHGATAALVDRVLARAEKVGAPVRAVDLSADFRLDDLAVYEATYGQPHGAPARLADFVAGVPELCSGRPPKHAAQPGCFTTAATLAAHPFLALGICEPEIFVAAVTGSSGSGRTPGAGTHHPERAHNLYAYNPLGHRHETEMRTYLARAAGRPVEVAFVPHSGPFVRGIHATVSLRLREPEAAAHLVERVNAFYGPRSFVQATTTAPKLTEVAGTNRARLGVFCRGKTLVVTAAIDNLVKGAAGGGVQWMNRLFDLDDDAGLRIPGVGLY